MKFTDLDLDPKVLKAVADTGYDTPTPIQAQAIPSALAGRDVLGIAQTGSGKTAAFTLPMISILAKGRARARMPRSLILCPTRELAAQVAENFEAYGKHHKLTMALLIGGVSFKDQDKLIDRGVDVLIATPGRLLDHFERGKLMLTGVQVMVVDEADRMLDMGFIPDIERIFGLTPFTRQTLFFSATMPPEITRITETFLHNPVRVEVAKQATTAETIDQKVCKHRPARRDTADKEKRELLRRIIDGEGEALTNGIIFCNRKRDVDVVGKSLKKHGYDAAPLHGDLDQSLRMRTLDGFRNNEIRLLIASDVAARGLDIPTVSHVINFDVPIHSEDYVHRIGRTGRAGRSGAAITLCFPHEQKHLDKIEELIGKAVPETDNPMTGGAKVEAEGAAPVDAPAEGAPESDAKSDEKPKRARRSRGGRRRRDEETPETQEAASVAASALDDPRGDASDSDDEAAPVVDETSAPPRRARRGRDRDADPREREERGGRRERSDRGADRSRGGRRGGGARVIGMGDHVPAFLMVEIPDWASKPPPEEADAEGDARDEAA
ncbi:MAG: DEAD/DEAH box helicase [Pseudomonadota bacterium]